MYQHCGARPSYRATVPVLVDPKTRTLLGNDSAPLVEMLNRWPHQDAPDLAPAEATDSDPTPGMQLLQPAINDGVYRCGFARNQRPTTALKPISSPPSMRWSRASKATVHGCAGKH